jgi:hypothetical protein
MGDGKLEREIIERGAEIVEAVANDQSKLSGRSFKHFDPADLAAAINIAFGSSSVRAFFKPSGHFGFKALQMVERPIEPSFVVERHGC